MHILLTFAATRDAIVGERLLIEAGEPVRAVPLPMAIAAGCGICLRLPLTRRESAIAVLEVEGAAVAGTYLAFAGGYRTFPRPTFTRTFGIAPGAAVAIVGCGGKTSLANRLAMENRHLPVLFSTTTRILPPPDSVVDHRLREADAGVLPPGVTIACERCGEKLRGVSIESLARLRPAGGLTILEADGSRGLPLKGWAEHEPVIPAFVDATVGVCSIGPVGFCFSPKMAHRPEIFMKTAGIGEGDIIGVGHIAAMIRAMFAKAAGRRILFINQVESPEAEECARLLAGRLDGMAIAAGSLRSGALRLVKGEE